MFTMPFSNEAASRYVAVESLGMDKLEARVQNRYLGKQKSGTSRGATRIELTRSKGHTEHTKTADRQLELAGQFHRPIKITRMGAGSEFTPWLMSDLVLIPSADGSG